MPKPSAITGVLARPTSAAGALVRSARAKWTHHLYAWSGHVPPTQQQHHQHSIMIKEYQAQPGKSSSAATHDITVCSGDAVGVSFGACCNCSPSGSTFTSCGRANLRTHQCAALVYMYTQLPVGGCHCSAASRDAGLHVRGRLSGRQALCYVAVHPAATMAPALLLLNLFKVCLELRGQQQLLTAGQAAHIQPMQTA